MVEGNGCASGPPCGCSTGKGCSEDGAALETIFIRRFIAALSLAAVVRSVEAVKFAARRFRPDCGAWAKKPGAGRAAGLVGRVKVDTTGPYSPPKRPPAIESYYSKTYKLFRIMELAEGFEPPTL